MEHRMRSGPLLEIRWSDHPSQRGRWRRGRWGWHRARRRGQRWDWKMLWGVPRLLGKVGYRKRCRGQSPTSRSVRGRCLLEVRVTDVFPVEMKARCLRLGLGPLQRTRRPSRPLCAVVSVFGDQSHLDCLLVQATRCDGGEERYRGVGVMQAGSRGEWRYGDCSSWPTTTRLSLNIA